MLTVLSFLFWLLTGHAVLVFFAALLLIGLVSWRRRRPGFALVVFPLALLNMIVGQFANAAFLTWPANGARRSSCGLNRPARS